MGTNNFHYVNTSKCYAVLESWEDENGEMQSYEQDDISSLYWDIKQALEEQGLEIYIPPKYSKDYNELRSIPSSFIQSVETKVCLADVTIDIIIDVVLRSGYYDGACLDYNVSYGDDGTDISDLDLEWCEFVLEQESNLPLGMQRIQAKNLLRNLVSKTKEVTDKIEEAFTKNSTPLIKVGTFSNGEAIYIKS